MSGLLLVVVIRRGQRLAATRALGLGGSVEPLRYTVGVKGVPTSNCAANFLAVHIVRQANRTGLSKREQLLPFAEISVYFIVYEDSS